MRALDASLQRLGTDYVDLYLIHWPGGDGDVDTWRAFEKLRDDGRARCIGVSNFSPQQIDLLSAETGTAQPCGTSRSAGTGRLPRSCCGGTCDHHSQRKNFAATAAATPSSPSSTVTGTHISGQLSPVHRLWSSTTS